MNYVFNLSEIEQITAHGLSEKEAAEQIDYILSGTKKPELVRPATIGDGIRELSKFEIKRLSKLFNEKKNNFTFTKFVPASGAATRMFKALSATLYEHKALTYSELKDLSGENEDYSKTLYFLENLTEFPFTSLLEESISINESTDVIPLLEKILTGKGLNLSDSPKALIPFHKDSDNINTPVYEHLNEAVKLFGNYANIHFTVSEKHAERFEENFDLFLKRNNFSREEISLDYSFQLSKTDTIALDEKNQLAKDEEGNVIFRPAGHGALIENLNKIDSDFIFISNIDNIAHPAVQKDILPYKQALGGLAIKIKEKIDLILLELKSKINRQANLEEIEEFLSENLFIDFKNLSFSETAEIEFLLDLLNRPFRIAAMVKNEGEPGGGPFWIKEKENFSLQIIEKSQIDFSDSSQVEILNSSTHFNPVDMVCSVKDYNGDKFDLTKFVNPDLGIVTKKSYNGKELKVLELPGLWNGAMHNWLTFFVELPLFTFNPVKEINDLLKENHLGK